MQYPKMSIVTPSYNQGKFLEKTILSVLNQNYPNLEYIIMDGASSDNSVEIIKKYADKLAYWQSKPDGGQSAAINEGFRHATGDIYAWLNSDDQYAEKALKTVGEYFINHPECQWLCGIGKMINTKGKVIETIIPKELDFESLCDWLNNIISQPSIFCNKTIWFEALGLNEKLNCAMDFDLWLKFSKISKGHTINKLLSIALKHENMKTQRIAYESWVETGLLLCQHGEFEKAKQLLLRPVKRAFEMDKLFSIVTRNKLYRKWREWEMS